MSRVAAGQGASVPRHAGWYVVAIGALAARSPFFAVMVADAGAPDVVIPLVVALLPLGVLVAGPLFGARVDASARPGAWLVGLVSLAAVGGWLAWAAAAWQLGWLALAAGVALMSPGIAPIYAIVDVSIFDALRGDTSRYGRVRLWGSVGFLLVMALLPAAMAWRRPAPLLANAVLLSLLVPLSHRLVAERGPGDEQPSPQRRERRLSLRSLGPRGRALVRVATVQGAVLAAWDLLFALHVERSGMGASVASQAINVSVGCEIGVMALMPALVARFGLERLLFAGLLVGLPRGLLTAGAESFGALGPVVQVATQALHGLGYGAFWMAALALADREAPRGQRVALQTLLFARTYGLAAIVAMVGSAGLLRWWSTRWLFVFAGGLGALAAVWWAVEARRADGGPPLS